MGFRVRKRIRVAPGVNLNLSKSGASLSVGPRGAKVNVGPKGTRVTAGIPGTGAYYTQRLGSKSAVSHQTVSRRSGSASYGDQLAIVGQRLEHDDQALLQLQGALQAADPTAARPLIAQVRESTQELRSRVNALTPPRKLGAMHSTLEAGLTGRYEGLVALDVAMSAEESHPDRDNTPAVVAALDRLNEGNHLLTSADSMALEAHGAGQRAASPAPAVPRSGARTAGSWWILWTLTLFLDWVAFLYIGIRAHQKKWLLASAAYFAAVAQYFVVDSLIDNHGDVFGASIILLLLADGIALVHALRARKEYQYRMQFVAEKRTRDDFALKERIAEEYGGVGDLSPRQVAEAKLRRCDDLVAEIETQSVDLDLLPTDSATRREYLHSLQVRADGAWLLENASSDASLGEADRKLSEALSGLERVCGAISATVPDP